MVRDFLLKNMDIICPKETPSFLNFKNSFQLLIMVILSAQTTDRQVNKVSPTLFRAYPTPEHMAFASLSSLEEIIYKTGFYHMKAKFIQATAKGLVEQFNSTVPDNIEDLLSLKGVGRKTANVVLGTVFNKPVIIVDTHFKRVTNRLGLTTSQSPTFIERELKVQIPDIYQFRVSMWLNKIGRDICMAHKPQCKNCYFQKVCPSSRVF